MHFSPIPRRLSTTILALAAALAACDESPDTGVEPQFAAHETGWERTAFDVYSQNLYLGGDTGPLFDPDVVGDPVALVTAVGAFWNDVQQSDVAARMDAIAEHIARRNPEVVGLQEALHFVTLGPTLQPDGQGSIDFLGALEQAISDRGLPYEVATHQPTTSSALPLAIDFTTGQVTRYLGFTDRLVILRRADVAVTASGGGTYAFFIPVAPGVDVKRGWTRVSVNHDGTPHHFVNTHLETQAARPINEAQGQELLGIVSGLEGVTLVAGDLNSDAEATEGDPSYTRTYENFIDSGFADLWELSPRSGQEPGFTCCQDNDLRNVTSVLDERIDFVLVRSSGGPIPGEGARRGHFRLDVLGDGPADMTASGLWPSDHAGLSGSVRNADGTAED
jgi:endonuclease/exonuclease/phosphatase family metal-dependent hydrolase